MELSKAFEPQKYEDEIYSSWEKSGFFNPEICVKQGKISDSAPAFTVVLPPPNVTGTLHIGHAAMLAIQDVMIRYHRLKGDKTLWLPGTDHAAIATQTKVEKLLMAKGMNEPKKELGREKFLEEVNKFAQESHDTIVDQCKKMGSSLDWSREAFTLDEARNLAVRTIFKKMYDDGLIYRGYRIVNWCPRCQSTLADDEVEYKEQSAKLYTFKYSIDFPITIATTRPETKLGDTAVAVNPNDERYKQYIGQTFVVKSFAGGADLKIKIIGEEEVDINFGTGAVGVTPAHSFVDYEMSLRHDLEIIPIIDENGKMTTAAGENYVGLTVKEAREKVVENLQSNGLMIKEEDVPNNLSVCYRCGHTIEPIPSRQWFIDVNKEFSFRQSEAHPIVGLENGDRVTLKKLMHKVVENSQIEIIPDRFAKVYFHWIDDLRDWCISRQIWYGHRIPVWYKGEEVYVGTEAPAGDGWEQDPDTLDTWFSSGLWTFSTLGWPNQTTDLATFHPNSVMETGYDILFFWVARMILMTTYALGEIPFEKVYLHGLVRDDQGRKMSKSLGNVINPLDTIGQYGADATRLSLLIGNTPGNDLRLSEEKVASFRNFTNKLWNMSRFMLLNISNPVLNVAAPAPKTLADKWILSRLDAIIKLVTENIEKFNFSYAGEQLRDFTWGEIADWYLEIAKIEGEKEEILNYILNTLLKLWHPFMPFVTEAIWQEVYGKENILMVEKWPVEIGITSVEEFDLIKEIITGVRSLRAENKIEPAKKLSATISAGDKLKLLEDNKNIIIALGRLENLNIIKSIAKPEGAVGFVVGVVEIFIDFSGVVDVEREKNRLQSELEQIEKYLVGLEAKLSNVDFVQNAPPAVVGKERQKLQEAKDKKEKINNQLVALK